MKIDFVICWVDENDLKWKSQKEAFQSKANLKQKDGDDANAVCRYRDMGLLRYWFRSVEKNAPWVNKVFFVTCGQKPEWLNEHNPKLVLVNHDDFIPSEYLPTFNSPSIENNLHRIPTLSEQFVLFNDDMYLLKPVDSGFFFKNGYPVLPCNLNICRLYGNDSWSKVCIKDFCTVNEHFDIKKSIWDNRRKWFSVFKLGPNNAFKNYVRFLVNQTFSVSGYEHVAEPHLKSTIEEVWSMCPDIMEATSMSRFRSDEQVNQWLFVAWNLASGRFYPVREGKRGKCFNFSSNDIGVVKEVISQQRMSLICVNDSFRNDNPEYCFRELADAFQSILPEKSSFEL